VGDCGGLFRGDRLAPREIALLFLASGNPGRHRLRVASGRAAGGRVGTPLMAAAPLGTAAVASAAPVAASAAAATGSILARLLIFFLKAGSLTFGSGLVIVPFLQNGLVQQTGWLQSVSS